MFNIKFIAFGITLTLVAIVSANAESLKITAKSWDKFNHIGNIKVEDNCFSAKIFGIDPWITTTKFTKTNAKSLKFICFELLLPKDTTSKAQIFWKSDEENKYSGSRHINIRVTADGKWHKYKVLIANHRNWKGTINGIRFDPATAPEVLGIFKLRNFELLEKDRAPTISKSIVNIKLSTKGAKAQLGKYPEDMFSNTGALLVDGKATFMLHTGDLPVIDNPFSELSAAGFNLITFAGISRGIIKELQKNNLKLMLSVRGNKHETEKSFKKRLDNLYNRYPELADITASYYSIDEPAWVSFPFKAVNNMYKVYKNHKPRRPVFMNHAPRNSIALLKKYNTAADITGCDIYPVPDGGHSDLTDKTLSSVGAYTDKMWESALPGQPVWMYLQAYARAKTIPTCHETRFMAYNAIMHGAMGLCYYGLRHLSWPNKMWPQLKKFCPEIRALNDVLVAPWSSKLINNNGIEIRYKLINGELYIFIANTVKQIQKLNLNLAPELKKLFVLFENRSIALKNGVLSESFKPYDVHIYSTKALKKTKRNEIKETNLTWLTKSNANWIWLKEFQRKKATNLYFRRVFELDKIPGSASIIITADDNYRLYCNGKLVGEDIDSSQGGWKVAERYNLKPYLKSNTENIIAVEVINDRSMAGLWAEIKLDSENIYTDELWRASAAKVKNWRSFLSDENWKSAYSYGKPPCFPWNSFLKPVK